MPQLFQRSHGAPYTGSATLDALRLSCLDDTASGPETDRNAPGDIAWTNEEVVRLHCLLLGEIRVLANPEAPLDEIFDVLCWIFTEPENDERPFSFASCLHVAACDPESTFPFCGRVHPDDVRDLIRQQLKKWFAASLARYPGWVREAIRKNPLWTAMRLASDPQCINRQLRLQNIQGSLFA